MESFVNISAASILIPDTTTPTPMMVNFLSLVTAPEIYWLKIHFLQQYHSWRREKRKAVPFAITGRVFQRFNDAE